MKLSLLTNCIIAALCVQLLTGCSFPLWKTGQYSTTELPASYHREVQQDVARSFPERWWESFNDPLLTSLIDQALAKNLDIAQAYSRFEQAETLVRIAGADRQPYLNMFASETRAKQASFSSSPESSWNLSLAAGYEVDIWNKYGHSIAARQYESLAAKEDINTLYLSITARLADLYYFAIEQRAQLQFLDKIVVSYEESLFFIETRYLEGLNGALDVHQARQNLAATKARRPLYEVNLAVAEHAIAVLCGHFPGEVSAGEIAQLPPVTDMFARGLPADLLKRRPDIQAALHRVQSKDEQIGTAVAERFPAVNLLANAGRGRFNLGQLVTDSYWSLIGEMMAPLFDGGRRKNEVERSKIVLQQELLNLKEVTLIAVQEVEDALVKNRITEQRITLLEDVVSTSRNSFETAMEQYVQGLQGYLPVLIAQRSLFEAETKLLVVRREFVSDRISLLRALGGSWMSALADGRIEEKSHRDPETQRKKTL